MEFIADLATTKADREADKLSEERLEHEINGLGWKTCVNSYELAVMRKLMEFNQNQNYILQEQIYSYYTVI